MSEDNQIVTPRAFIELFMTPGRSRPTETREHIAARHELCEDLAQMLAERARALKADLGVTYGDVLVRMRQGLHGEGSGISAAETVWVMGRLAELLDWPGDTPGNTA